MKSFITNFVVLSLTAFSVTAGAQTAAPTSAELSCRSKAKEIAAQTYNSCVTESRQTQIDQIRKDYQKQLADLKSKYDKELKKMGNAKPVNTAAAQPATVLPAAKAKRSASTGSVPKATKGIAKVLPTRKEVKNPAPPAQEVQENQAVMTSDAVAPDLEAAAAVQNEPKPEGNSDLKIELVPATSLPEKNTAATDEPNY